MYVTSFPPVETIIGASAFTRSGFRPIAEGTSFLTRLFVTL